jgi:hypothetical protein
MFIKWCNRIVCVKSNCWMFQLFLSFANLAHRPTLTQWHGLHNRLPTWHIGLLWLSDMAFVTVRQLGTVGMAYDIRRKVLYLWERVSVCLKQHIWLWRLLSTGRWRRVIWQKFTEVSNDPAVSIIKDVLVPRWGEVSVSPETSDHFYRNTRHHIPEYGIYAVLRSS